MNGLSYAFHRIIQEMFMWKGEGRLSLCKVAYETYEYCPPFYRGFQGAGVTGAHTFEGDTYTHKHVHTHTHTHAHTYNN